MDHQVRAIDDAGHSMGWAFKTLDGAETFHGMDIIGAATPGTKQRKAIRREVTATLETVIHHGQSLYTLFWCFRRRSVIGLRGGAAELHC